MGKFIYTQYTLDIRYTDKSDVLDTLDTCEKLDTLLLINVDTFDNLTLEVGI